MSQYINNTEHVFPMIRAIIPQMTISLQSHLLVVQYHHQRRQFFHFKHWLINAQEINMHSAQFLIIHYYFKGLVCNDLKKDVNYVWSGK